MPAIRIGVKAVAAVAVMAAAFCIYCFFNPEDTWWMPKCPVYFLTGLQCPGCGSQRAIHALLHGRIGEAFAFNALLILLIPFLMVMAYAELTRARNPRLYRSVSHPAVIISILMIVAGWTIFRNLS